MPHDMKSTTEEPFLPPKKQKQTEQTVPELVTEMRDWFIALERSVAAYNHLHLSLASFMNQIQEGERKKGLPIFTFKATCDGVKAIDVVADLAEVAKRMPKYVPHVMVPLINMQAINMQEALEEIKIRLELLDPILKQMVTVQDEEKDE